MCSLNIWLCGSNLASKKVGSHLKFRATHLLDLFLLLFLHRLSVDDFRVQLVLQVCIELDGSDIRVGLRLHQRHELCLFGLHIIRGLVHNPGFVCMSSCGVLIGMCFIEAHFVTNFIRVDYGWDQLILLSFDISHPRFVNALKHVLNGLEETNRVALLLLNYCYLVYILALLLANLNELVCFVLLNV